MNKANPAHLPPFVPARGICGSCAMNIDGMNWLAGTRFISDLAAPATIYPLENMRSIKGPVAELVSAAKPRATGRPNRRLS